MEHGSLPPSPPQKISFCCCKRPRTFPRADNDLKPVSGCEDATGRHRFSTEWGQFLGGSPGDNQKNTWNMGPSLPHPPKKFLFVVVNVQGRSPGRITTSNRFQDAKTQRGDTDSPRNGANFWAGAPVTTKKTHGTWVP